MARIRIGCIGMGIIAWAEHLPGIAACDELELKAICDPDTARLHEAGEKYGIDHKYRFTDWQELISCPEVDAVDIMSPNDTHHAIALGAVRAGKPYCLEKPVAMNKDQARELYDLTIGRGIPNMICFSYRYKAAARYARDIINKGLLGDLYHINMQYYQSWALPEFRTPRVWRFSREKSGSGALGDLGTHAIDLVRFISGKEIYAVVSQAGTVVKSRPLPDKPEVEGVVDVDDYCNFLADMGPDLSASLQITRLAYGRGNYQRLEIYGNKGALVYKLDETPGRDELAVCLGYPGIETHDFSEVSVPQHYQGRQMQAFAAIAAGGNEPYSADIRDGLLNQIVLDAVIESFAKRVWINIDMEMINNG